MLSDLSGKKVSYLGTPSLTPLSQIETQFPSTSVDELELAWLLRVSHLAVVLAR
jgi:hypothetical protein